MEIGFCGMGKLGLPVALAIESKGHNVVGYDISPQVKNILESKRLPYREIGAQELLDKTKIKFLSLRDVIKQSEIIFVPIQTPHQPKYEGITKLEKETKDFDYTYLKEGIKQISNILNELMEDRVIIIISTVLPTTIDTQIKPLLSKYAKLCYNPFFIAMGETIPDFLNPEIILFGVDDKNAVEKAKKFYRTISDAPFKEMSIVNAELVKVNYNTWISMKINYGNNLMEVCHRLREYGADVDTVLDALFECKKRIISTKYLRGGLPDSGGCHLRDAIALADFVKKYGVSNDLYTTQMIIREHHIEWFTEIINEQLNESRKIGNELKILILGKAYKPETNLTVGSSAIRLSNELNEKGIKHQMYDPYVDTQIKPEQYLQEPYIYFIATKHDDFVNYNFPKGSIIIDPFRYIPSREGITVIPIGKPQEAVVNK